VHHNPQEFPFTVGDQVVVLVEKGEDLGRVVNMGPLVDKRADGKEMSQIVRRPSDKDLRELDENQALENEAFNDCRKRIEEHGLDMKLVDVEYQLDRKKITFYFTSNIRVDFRALVRELAGRYRTRIELRQIGVRDEAKRLGGLGVCGRRHCCTTFLREFEPVVTQFAKDQNLALNPTKLSGGCGRLMCCLRYEKDLYIETLKRFPKIGSPVKTSRGTGRIKKIEIIAETAIIVYENHEEERIGLDELNQLMNESQTKKRRNKHRGKKRRSTQQKKKPEDTNIENT